MRTKSFADPGYDANPRELHTATVMSVVPAENGGATINTDGFSFFASAAVAELLPVGKTFQQETIGFSKITGYLIDGVWVERKTDADLVAEHQEFVARLHRERDELLERNRADWQEREAALPEWIRTRLENFHDKGGAEFERDGWGYELVVAELAVLYVEHPESLDADYAYEHESIREYASKEGTSGNQHGFAKALARAHLAGSALRMSVSALSQLTGDPYYAGADSGEPSA